MSTPKELEVHVGNYVQFTPQENTDNADLVHLMTRVMPNEPAQELFLDAGLKNYGLIGKCRKIVPTNTGDVYIFARIRSDDTLSNLTIPVPEGENCLESILYRWT